MKKLDEQMSFYLRYHRDARNKLTHFIGVPAIIFALLVAMDRVSLGISINLSSGGAAASSIQLSLAFVFLAIVLAYYFVLDIPLAIGMTLFSGVLLWLAQVVNTYGSTTAWVIIAITFIGGWVFQLAGHVFEGKKPALVDNFFQIFIAPLFLAAELVFALGLRANLRTRVEKLAQQAELPTAHSGSVIHQA